MSRRRLQLAAGPESLEPSLVPVSLDSLQSCRDQRSDSRISDRLPVHHIPPRGDVVRPAVLVLQVVRVLPDVEAEQDVARRLPSMSGLSWFGVRVIDSLPPSRTSHAQPEPKRPTPAAANCSLNFAKLAERRLDRRAERARRLAAAVRRHRGSRTASGSSGRRRCCAPRCARPRARCCDAAQQLLERLAREAPAPSRAPRSGC